MKPSVSGRARGGRPRCGGVWLVSGGWASGDPAVMGGPMAALARLAHRIVWVRPRCPGDDDQPLGGGMAAALPHVDAFVSGHSLAALDEVVAAIADP